MFNLHYHVRNNGDGSVTVIFHQTRAEAVAADEAQSSKEGWSEESVGTAQLKVENGQIFFRPRGSGAWRPLEIAEN